MPHCFCVRQPGKRKLSAQFIEQNRNDWWHFDLWRSQGERTRHFPYFTKISENTLNREIFVSGGRVRAYFFFAPFASLFLEGFFSDLTKIPVRVILYKAICRVLTSC